MGPRDHGYPPEVNDSLDDMERMTHADLCDYFRRLATDHICSGTFATAADYLTAAQRIEDLNKAYLLVRGDAS